MSLTFSPVTIFVSKFSIMGQTFTYFAGYQTPSVSRLSEVDSVLDGNTIQRVYTYSSSAANPYELIQVVTNDPAKGYIDVAGWTYDSSGRAIHCDDNASGSLDIDYTHLSDAVPYVTTKNANGYQQRYFIAHGTDGSAYIQQTTGLASGNGNVAPSSTYIANNNQDQPTIMVDGNGYATLYGYDAATGALTLQVKGYQWNGGSLPVTASQLSETSTMSKMQVTQLDAVFPYPKQIIYSGKTSQGWANTKQGDIAYD